MKKYCFTLFFLCLIFVIHAQNCNDLIEQYKSYNEAIRKIKIATFKVEDKVDCSKSSWILKASFYSCDGEKGYFIVTTKEGKEYIHQNMPISIWKHFRNASSFGTYFNEKI